MSEIKSYTSSEWATIFGMELVDNKGFKTEPTKKISLDLFVSGVNDCTIKPVNKERWKVFVALTRNVSYWR
jgi:hypothetical protein